MTGMTQSCNNCGRELALVTRGATVCDRYPRSYAGQSGNRRVQVTKTQRIGDDGPQKCPPKRYAIDNQGRVEQMPRCKFDTYFIPLAHIDSRSDMSFNVAPVPAAAEQPRTTAFARGTASAIECRRYLNDGRRCVYIDGENPPARIFHSVSVPQARVRTTRPSAQAH